MAPSPHPEASEKTNEILTRFLAERFVSAVKGAWPRWRKRHADLRHYRELIEKEDHILRDIGVTRAEVAEALSRLRS